MSEELKEILVALDNSDEELRDKYPLKLTIEQQDILFNYITDLQEKNKHLNLQLEQALKDYDEELTKRYKAIEYIKQCGGMELVNNYSFPTKPIIDKEAKQELLEILGGNNE